jgi:predicted TIM-barrel fold metal-dependent hydrolase
MFPIWKRDIEQLARCPNVMMKLGGLGSFLGGFLSYHAQPPASSDELAEEWSPYIGAGIEAFGVERCMFESNYPVDAGAGSYGTIWNAFKRLARGCSRDERAALFAGTAADAYRLNVTVLVPV